MKKYCIVSMGEEDALIVVDPADLRPALKRVRGLVERCKDDELFMAVEISFRQFDTWRPFVLGEEPALWCEWFDLTHDLEAEEDDRIKKVGAELSGFEEGACIVFHEKHSGARCDSALIPWEWCDE